MYCILYINRHKQRLFGRMYLETLSRNKERVNIVSTTFNFGLRLCVFVCGVPPVAKKNHKRHMGSAKTKPGCQSPTDGGGRGGVMCIPLSMINNRIPVFTTWEEYDIPCSADKISVWYIKIIASVMFRVYSNALQQKTVLRFNRLRSVYHTSYGITLYP